MDAKFLRSVGFRTKSLFEQYRDADPEFSQEWDKIEEQHDYNQVSLAKKAKIVYNKYRHKIAKFQEDEYVVKSVPRKLKSVVDSEEIASQVLEKLQASKQVRDKVDRWTVASRDLDSIGDIPITFEDEDDEILTTPLSLASKPTTSKLRPAPSNASQVSPVPSAAKASSVASTSVIRQTPLRVPPPPLITTSVRSPPPVPVPVINRPAPTPVSIPKPTPTSIPIPTAVPPPPPPPPPAVPTLTLTKVNKMRAILIKHFGQSSKIDLALKELIELGDEPSKDEKSPEIKGSIPIGTDDEA